jgi:hypothetical protein
MLNRGEQDEIDKFNKLLQTYQEMIDPSVAEQRESLMDKFDAMSDLFSADSTKVPKLRITSTENTDSSHKLSPKKAKK